MPKTKSAAPSPSPALAVESIPLDALTLDPSNVRLHPEASIEAIKGSLMRFGQQKPIVVNGDGVIVAGNGTLSAARALGWTHLDAVRTALTGSEAVAFAIADNRTAEVSEWDTEALGRIVEAMKQEDPDLADAMGFDADAMVKLAAAAGAPLTEEDEDVAPEPPADPHSKLGDVWVMGKLEHRVMCGDSTNAEDVATLLDGAKVGCIVTDPPYGMSFKGKKFGKGGIANDGAEFERVLREAVALFPDVNAAVCFSTSRLDAFFRAVEMLTFCRMLTIYKPNRQGYPWRSWVLTSEFVAIFDGATDWPEPANFSHDVYTFSYESKDRPGDAVNHPTVKPLSIITDLVRKLGSGAVLDPFIGSGTTLIAAELLNRTCYGMELDPAYVDVCVHRWQRRTGKRATHADTGELFPETPAVETPAAPPAPTS